MTSNVISIESVAAERLPEQWRRPARSAAELADDYVAWGKAFGGRGGRGWSGGHAGNVTRHLLFWIGALDLRSARDLDGALFVAERALSGLKGRATGQMSLDLESNDTGFDPKTGSLGDTSIRAYGVTLKAFSAWLVNRDVLKTNPFEKLTLPLPGGRGSKRRALTVGEIHALLSTAPAKRRMLYELALVTGLRANELRSVRQFDVSRIRDELRLSDVWTKNRRVGVQPLPIRAAESVRAFGLPHVPRQTARMLRRDLSRAGIPPDAGGETLDFHALRVTFATLLDAAGATEKEAQVLMRHACKSLTYEVYTKTNAARLAELVEKVGAMIVPPKREAMLWD